MTLYLSPLTRRFEIAMPQDGETEISETAPATLVALDQRLKITDSPDTEQVKEEGEVVTEAYIKLSTVQWEWGDVLPAWQVS